MNTPDPQVNPYQPPRAPVADLEDAQSEVRPRLVNIAVTLIAISTVVGLMNTTLMVKGITASAQFGAFLISAGISTLLVGWITYKIWRGRNWARITLLILVLAAFAISIPQFSTLYRLSVLYAGLFVARSALLIAALAILFLTSARQWFWKGTDQF